MAAPRALNTVMLRRLRTSRAVRLALCAAALLSIAASFGLHPEPGDGLASRAASLASAADPQRAHGCVACLNHGLALTSSFSVLLASGLAWTPASPSLDPLPHGRLVWADSPGRAPPFDRS